MIFLPFFKPSSIHWSNVAGFHAPPDVAVTVTFIAAWFFPILWNVIAMEAAACYVGECRGGARDAKIALTAEGMFGAFIYILTPLMFVAVLGVVLTTADPLTLYLTYTNHIFGPGSWEKWFVGLPLIPALALSVLNAIMGCGRSLYQAAEDGQLPRWFQKKNRHGVPGNAMAFNVVCSAILVLLGSPLRIYIISNGGYLLSCTLAFAGYFVYRHLRPDVPRPFRLPTVAKWVALRSSWSGPPSTSTAAGTRPRSLVGPGQGPGLYLLGLLIVALYAPLYWWRAWQDRRLAASGHSSPIRRPRSPGTGSRSSRQYRDGGRTLGGRAADRPVGPRHAVRAAWLGKPPTKPAGVLLASPGTRSAARPSAARASWRRASRSPCCRSSRSTARRSGCRTRA